MEFKTISHGGLEYESVVALRLEVLRTPLGLFFTEEELLEERNQLHFALYDDGHPIACLVVVRIDDLNCRIRQMAVSPTYQRQGLGHRLLNRVAETLREQGVTRLSLNAREQAVLFYEKSGFHCTSSMFKELGIPHYTMEKSI